MRVEDDQDVNNTTVPPLRLCFITPYPPRFDGIAVYSYELIKALRASGHTVYVICNPDRSFGGHAAQENLFPVMEPEKEGWFKDVCKVIAKLKLDVVHLQHEYGLFDVDGTLNTDLLDLLID